MTLLRNKTINKKSFSSGRNISVDFNLLDFETTVRDKGYDVIWQKAIRCPCKSIGNHHQTTCRNCGGTGWFFINPTKTRAIITSIDVERSYEQEGRRDLGMVMITMSHDDKISHMDKIQLINSDSQHSEVFYPRLEGSNNRLFAYTRYDIKSVQYVGLYEGDLVPLRRLTEENDDFTFIDNKIVLSDKFNGVLADYPNTSITIRYTHSPLFHIWEISHDSRDSLIDTGTQVIKLPVQGIGKRAHLILESENFQGDRLFNNSFNMNVDSKNKVRTTDKLSRFVKYTETQEVFNLLTDSQKNEIATICQSNGLPLTLPFRMI